jgi:dipeptidyl aminopeptidase/acylaminoacyl peptidase
VNRDLRQTPEFADVEAFFRSALEPGFGRPTAWGDPAPSPDGSQVAVSGTVRLSMDGIPENRLFLVPGAGGEVRQISFGPHHDVDPRWSPDGSRLAFRSDRRAPGLFQLYVFEAGALGEAQPLAAVPGVVEHFRWSADGTQILMVVAGELAEQADGLGSGTLVQPTDVPDWLPEVESFESEDDWRSLWVLEVSSGEVRRASRPGLNVWEATWLGADQAAAIVSEAPTEGAWYASPLAVIDLDSGQERVVHRSEVQLGYVDGSPDGGTIAVVEAVASDRYFVAGDLLLVDAAGGTVRTVDTPGVDVTSPVWRLDGSLVAAGWSGLDSVALHVDPDGSVTELFRSREGMSFLQPVVAPVPDRGVAFALSSATRPPVVARVDDGVLHVLADSTHDGNAGFAAVRAETRTVTWTAPDGWEIQGLLAIPAGVAEPYPLLVHVHGGPIGQHRDTWPQLLDQLFVSRGYAVLFPNPRGSSGCGQEFASAVVGDMGGADSYDVLSGIDYLVGEGLVDPERVGVYGGSYGGFMAAWLPTLDARFKAAVALSPVTDWYSEHFGSSLIDWVGGFLRDSPERPDGAHYRRSPVFAGEGLRTPTLLTAGLRDKATPAGQAVEHYRALVARGVPAEVAVYPKEGHGVRAMDAAIDLSTRAIMWVQRFMRA